MVILSLVMLSGGIILDEGLLLADGKERIVMDPGDKVYLKIQDAIWKYPVFRGLEFGSKRPQVAYVDRYGWIHALTPGRTMISVWNAKGDNGTVEIVVRGKGKLAVGTTLGLICFVLAVFAVAGSKNISLILTKITNRFCVK